MNFMRFFFGLLLCFCALPASAQEDASAPVLHIKIEGEIEHGVAAYLQRAITQAETDKAKALLVEINTPGGRLDSALTMKDALLNSKVPTIAYVNRHAYSAGALIALACKEIYMAPGSVMGAATPVDQDGGATGEKIVSGTRSAFAAAAEFYDRDTKIAEAMVDNSLVISDVTEDGKLLTLTAQQALDLAFVNGVAKDRAALLETLSLSSHPIKEVTPTAAEDIVRFITSPLVSSLLLTLAMIALFAEFKAPGLGVGGVIAVCCYALFFWGHHLAGLAGWEDAALVLLGIALIAIEIFIVPGFGIFGIAGLGCLLGGFYISLIGDIEKTPHDILLDMSGIVSLSLICSVLFMVIGYRFFFKGNGFDSGIVLTGKLKPYREETEELDHTHLSVGDHGIAQSDLRPSGTALFGQDKHSVSSDGDFIESGSKVEIIKISGSNITVRIKT